MMMNVYKKDRNEGGWYERTVWTENKAPLSKNKSGSLGRLKSLLKRLEQNPKILQAYDHIIRDRLVNNVIEKFSENQSENPKEFFLRHRPVV